MISNKNLTQLNQFKLRRISRLPVASLQPLQVPLDSLRAKLDKLTIKNVLISDGLVVQHIRPSIYFTSQYVINSIKQESFVTFVLCL
jgi:hypothetical protein